MKEQKIVTFNWSVAQGAYSHESYAYYPEYWINKFLEENKGFRVAQIIPMSLAKENPSFTGYYRHSGIITVIFEK